MLLKVGPLLLGVLLAGPGVQRAEVLEQPEATRHVLLQVFYPKAVYEAEELVRRELGTAYPSTFGLPSDHPLLPLSEYQKKLFDAHQRLMEDPGYRELLDRNGQEIQPELPQTISQYEGREILYRAFLGKGIYERLLREAGSPPALPPGLRDPRGETGKPFFKRVDADLPKVTFPPSLMVCRYCADGVRYNALAGVPFREAHERLVAKDEKYRAALAGAMADLKRATGSDERLTLQFRQVLLDAGIDKLLDAEASRQGNP